MGNNKTWTPPIGAIAMATGKTGARSTSPRTATIVASAAALVRRATSILRSHIVSVAPPRPASLARGIPPTSLQASDASDRYPSVDKLGPLLQFHALPTMMVLSPAAEGATSPRDHEPSGAP